MSKTLDEILERHKSYYRNAGDLENDMDSYKAKQQLSQLIAEIIGVDEVFLDIPVVDHTGKEIRRITGESYTPYMVARNNLRAEARQRAKERGIDL